ncbi:ABC transporter substrate-binding protein [Paenibacillus sp. JCM 10914]|uniref:ABC transporter substrate-binding protein n=1 Tax=Paenibacillus sp. JCM 10914 TaxID=1236974 RepID=UPI0003CC3D04|nr:ABC transporter substrate-binding protein [Paenibacillus sp. JCM 10914]GAE07157.1 multiple sugar ABC transporter, substrate-binding protein [Paenibacillus sp. JCM 10914]
MNKGRYRVGLALIVILVMIVSGCGAGSSGTKSAGGKPRTETDGKLPPYEVSILFYGTNQKDLKLVEDEISKITKEKINATVKLNRIEPAAWQQQRTLMLAGNEKVDLIFTGENEFITQVAQRQLLPLDELLTQHGQGVIDAFEPDVLAATKINGQTYGLPSIRDFGAYPTIMMRTDLLEKYKLDVSNIKTLEELGPIFKTIKENEPNLNLLGKSGSSIAYSVIVSTVDTLGDSLGVLASLDELKVVNLYETPEYIQLLKTIREWYEAGYIPKDIATTTQTGRDYIQANVGFATMNKGKPGAMTQTSQRIGVPLTEVKFFEPKTDTMSITNAMFAIASNSKDPERAMMVLNLMYSDEQIVNLLNWGVEGKHYEVRPNNTVGFPEGVDATSSGYNLRQGWMFGNQLLSHPWETDEPTLWEQMAEFNKNSKKSAALGFSYNPDPVKTEIAALNNVVKQYAVGLESGTADLDETLPKFIAALKSAGIDRVVAEKQKQLDEWAANNNK